MLSGLRIRLFVRVPVCVSCRYGWMFALTMFMSLMLLWSAYVVSFTGACGIGVSDVYMLKSVCDSTPPCGTLFLNWCCVDVLFLNVVYALRALM